MPSSRPHAQPRVQAANPSRPTVSSRDQTTSTSFSVGFIPMSPLTIDQTDCLSNSVGIQLAAQSPRHVRGQYDLVVAHPELTFADGRPAWRANGAFVKVEIPSHLISQSTRTIVEARFLDEPMDAVPIDRLMLWPGEFMPLLLPAGPYRIVAFHEGSYDQMSVEIDVSLD